MKEQRPHREQDPRVRRSVVAALACAALFVGIAVAVVAVRVQQVHFAYQLDALRTERTRTETLIRQLEVEVATLKSPRRVELQARQLGMAPPSPSQLARAREFLTGATGMAAARAARIEAQVR